MKFVGAFFFYLMAFFYLDQQGIYMPWLLLVFSVFLFFVVPIIFQKVQSKMREARWQVEARQDRINRANQEEYEHQTALRRERERLEMHTEMRIKELIATLEVQHVADSRKMQQLASMKSEFANRQQTDMASLLGRLEAMKAAR